MNFIVTVLAHEPITAFTPLHLIAWITRIACAHSIYRARH